VSQDAATRVLDMLAKAGPDSVSGEALSEALGVSRAAVWKHVEKLRTRGYTITGERGGGYQLGERPDRLYAEEIQANLATRWLGREIEHLDTTDSTNRVAFEHARGGAAHGFAVIAEGQTAGRGRLGRSFFSPPYLNLYTSIALRPTLDTAAAPTLIPAAGVAVAEAIAEEVGDERAVGIKWPNDVQLGGLKTSGILMEMSAEAARIDFAILGIGINLNVDRQIFPDDFKAQATSLSSHLGRKVDRVAFTQRLFERLEEVLDAHAREGFAALLPRYEARFTMKDCEIRVAEIDGSERFGVARSVRADGALEVENDRGETFHVLAGDVTLVRPQTQ
jgi:BirA family biotin operon repressor/biotin-[acetyl-CoA-carboxylase] ligase